VNEWSDEPTPVEPRKNFLFRWLGKLGRWLRNFFALMGLLAFLGPIVLIWSILNLSDTGKERRSLTTDPSKPFSLWVQLDGSIAEHEPEMGETLFRQLFAQEPGIYIPNLRSALRNAAEDKMVKDLNLSINGLGGSPADLEELRKILVDFKASGKSITSWVSHMDNAALIIASTANKINLNPVSEVSLPGPAFSNTYFGDALKRLGIDMQIVKTGKFKSVFEPFIANEPSAESREALGSIERNMREHMVKLIAEGRQKQESEVFLWLQESFFTPAKAKELGIVDELAYTPHVKFDSGNDRLIDDYMDDGSITKRLKRGYSLSPNEGLGFIEAVGNIVSYEDGERSITSDAMTDELFWALENKDVKAIVLRIASPGGRADVADYIWDKVRTVNEKKPVIVSMGSVAASGGYYIAVGGSRIFADASTITGSIGVIGMLPNLEGLRDKWGVSFHTVTQSNRANILSGKKMTAQDQSYMQSTVEDVYRTFKSRVASSRNMSMEKVEELAQGRIYTGQQAKENGLVDEIGDLKDAFQFAKTAAGLDPNKLYPIHRYEPPTLSAAECLSSLAKLRKCFRRHGSSIKAVMSDVVFETKIEDFKLWQQVRDLSKEGGIVAVLPIRVRL
jgi:protease IV